MKPEDIVNSITQPSKMEELYRRDSSQFTKLFPEIYANNPNSSILQVWQERLFYKEQICNQESSKSLLVAIIIAIAAGLLVKVPEYTELINDQWFR